MFDIVFLDPPFDSAELGATLSAVTKCLSIEGIVYLESPGPIGSLTIPEPLILHREKRAGQVHYGLIRQNR
jgi:16S rRNA (guanine966-N2)-methyltransferase